MITWHFEGFEVYFTSTPENIETHIRKNRLLFKTDSPVIFDNGNIHHLNPSIALSSNGNTGFEDLEALDRSINSDLPEGQEATGLQQVSGNVDFFGSAATPVGDIPTTSPSSLTGDSIPSRRKR